MQDIIIIGYGGHASSVTDSITRQSEYNIVGYTDLRETCCVYKYLGTDDKLRDIYNDGIHNAILGIGYLGGTTMRDELYTKATQIGYKLPVIVDSTAVISDTVSIDVGTFVGKGAVINTHASIGKMCIINTGAILEHSNKVGDYTHIAVGAVLCGDVTVGDHTLVGANATVLQGVNIGMNCIIGAGSTVLSDVPDNTRVVGVWG